MVNTLVFHCCLCHVGPQVKKHSALAPAGFEKNHIRCNPSHNNIISFTKPGNQKGKCPSCWPPIAQTK